VLLTTESHSTSSHPVKEPAEPESPAPVHTDIQLLPQQAGMASILATAVINSEYTATTHPKARLQAAHKTEQLACSGPKNH
jgi:hypothetical protein